MTDRLSAYLARIGLSAPPAPDAEGLAQLQAAHRQRIAFENLDIPLGRGIAIDGDTVFAKLVTAGRGGFCFEMNRLFGDMLGAMGIAARPLLARVRLGMAEGEHAARTHVLLLAEIGGEQWIADAGFGGSYVPPLPLRDGAETTTPEGARHRLLRAEERGSLEGEWLLERAGPRDSTDGRAADHAEWQGQYCFDLAEVHPLDLEQANHWVATHPGSRFVTTQVVSRVLPDGFASLTGREFKRHAGGKSEKREINSAAEYRAVLADVFGIHLSADEVARLPTFA